MTFFAKQKPGAHLCYMAHQEPYMMARRDVFTSHTRPQATKPVLQKLKQNDSSIMLHRVCIVTDIQTETSKFLKIFIVDINQRI